MKSHNKWIWLFIVSQIVIVIILQGCGKKDESMFEAKQDKTNSKTKTPDAPSASYRIDVSPENAEQEKFNEIVFQRETTIHAANVSTREGVAQTQRAREDLRSLRESIVGRHIANWSCVAYQPLGPTDISVQLSERDGQRKAELICSADANTRFSNRLDENVAHEITLSIYENDAKNIGKVFNNDILTFSGVVKDFSSRGISKYFMRVNVESIKLSEAK